MKKKIIIIIGILFISISLSCLAYYYHRSLKVDNKRYIQLSAKEKSEDFDYAYNILKDNFPFFDTGKKMTGFDWLAHKKEFEDEIKNTKNDTEFFEKIYKIFSSVQNPHTYIADPQCYSWLMQTYKGYESSAWGNVLNNSKTQEKYKYWTKLLKDKYEIYYIPIYFKYVEGKYVVYKNSFGIPEGYILKEINNIDVDKYVKGLIDRRYLYYDYKKNKPYVRNLDITSDKDENISFTFESSEGKELKMKLKTQKYTYDPYANYSEDDVVSTKILDKNKTAYIKVTSMANNFEKYYSKMIDFYKEINDYPNLIIDIRENGGGADSFWENNIVSPLISSSLTSKNYILFRNGSYIKPFLDETIGSGYITSINDKPYFNKFKNKFWGFVSLNNTVSPCDAAGFKGRIYLLVDDGVYSSAESFASFAKDTKFASLIGTATGGGMGVNPAVAKLPNSGLVFNFAISCGLNSDGSINEETHTKPDIYAEETYSDFLKSNEWMKTNKSDDINPYDTVLNETLKIIKAAQ